MKLFRFLTCLIWGATFCLTALPARAQFTFTTNSGAITITGYTGSGGTVVIPSATNGYPVTAIGTNAFYNKTSITNVTIGNSVTYIGDRAFYSCSGLTAVTIPNSVTSIGSYAFSGCSGLTAVTIGNSVTTIGSYAFNYCPGLTAVTIPNSVTTIGGSAFSECYGLTAVTIGNGVTSIGSFAFHCGGLTAVTIPNSVTTIGSSAFSGCSGLTNVTIGNSVTNIGDEAFSHCSGLTAVTIPNSVTNIGSWVFWSCSGLTNIAVGAGNLSYASAGGVLFNKTLTTLMQCPAGLAGPYVISNSVTTIGNDAFGWCSGLTAVTIPNGVTNIGSYAFSGCSGLTNVTIGSSVTDIGECAFSGCSGLMAVTIPDSVTTIGGEAFSGCSGLTAVTIPNGVTNIGSYAFSGCSGLTNVTIGSSVTSIDYYAFSGCSGLTAVTIPNSVTCITEWAFGSCSGLTNIAVAAGNLSYASAGGVLFNKTLTTLMQCPAGLAGTYVISNSVTTIGGGAFSGCSGLTNVTIGSGVTSIDYYAFSGCSGLMAVTIPDSVTTIGGEAFSGCSGLTAVTIPNGVTNIGSYAFSYCTSLHQAYFQGNAPLVDGGAGTWDTTVFEGQTGTVYYVAGTTGWDSTFGGWPTFALSPAPQIIQQPQSTTSFQGATASFSVTAFATTPLAYQWRFCGTNLTNDGSLSGANSNLLTIANLQTNNAGNYTVIITNAYDSVTSSVAVLTVLPPGSFVWTMGGAVPWYEQTTNTHDGISAAQSGLITDGQESWMQTTVTGPGTLSYWWKVSSESGWDYLEFYLDGVLQSGSISGEVDWQQKTNSLAYGSHTLKWRYTKDGSASSGMDAGWVDEVVFLPDSPALPQISRTGLGMQTNGTGFGFNISYTNGASVVVEASTNLQNWIRVSTNTLVGGTNAFGDPAYTNYPRRFYRVRTQ